MHWLNKKLLDTEIQLFITENLNSDTGKISLSKSQFAGVSGPELSEQIIAKKKAEKKLPTWFNTKGIYYPPALSVEQASSEVTAKYKASLVKGRLLADLTAGFGVDDLYFSMQFEKVIAYEHNEKLAEIHAYNAAVLGRKNIKVIAADGMEEIEKLVPAPDLIYIDPARRSNSGKVFRFKDSTPDVSSKLAFLLSKTPRILIKSSPLLDISAGLSELKNVSAIHIISVKNECKELLWLVEAKPSPLKIICAALNNTVKTFAFTRGDEITAPVYSEEIPQKYLYEPDVALLKSGAFNLIGNNYALKKLHPQSQLFEAEAIVSTFPGRIYAINNILSARDLKQAKGLKGNVVVRNYPDKAENLVKKYKIQPSATNFLIFTEVTGKGYVIFEATILQHY